MRYVSPVTYIKNYTLKLSNEIDKDLVVDAGSHDEVATALTHDSSDSSNATISPLISKLIIVGIISTALAVALLIILSQGQEIQQYFRNVGIVLFAAAAASSSIIAAIKKPKGYPYKRILAIFSIGIVFWLTAESIWNYYVFVLGVEVPYPSVADVFYLVAYPFVGYFLYRGNKMLGEGKHDEEKLIATAITITVVAFIFNIFLVQIIDSSIGFSSLNVNDAILLILSIAYPILDAVLLVPAITIMYSAIRNHFQSLTWTLLAASMLVTVIADTGFGYTALVGLQDLANDAIWDILYSFLYILVTGAMIHEILSAKENTRNTMKNVKKAR